MKVFKTADIIVKPGSDISSALNVMSEEGWKFKAVLAHTDRTLYSKYKILLSKKAKK